MRINPTKQGGRRIQGETEYGDFDIVVDPQGYPISGFPIKIKTPPQPSRGLGDTIKKATDALGIPQCGGCKKRQDKLNKAVPYNDG